MGYRNPQQKGIRREWSRRYGYGGFPMAGGINKQASRGAIPANQFRHLENVSYLDPELGSRGGQDKMYSVAEQGCIMGIFEVSGAAGIYLQGGTSGFTLRYDPDLPPADEVTKLLVSGIQSPHETDETMVRRAFVIDEVARKLYAFGDGGQLMEFVFPEDGSVANSKLKVVIKGLGAPRFASGIVVPEMVLDTNARPGAAQRRQSNENIRGAMYLGALSDGIVRRYDGVSLTADSAALGGDRQIVFAYAETVWVAGSGYIQRRDSAGNWTNLTMPGGLSGTFLPVAAVPFLGSAYVIGRDAHATQKVVILKVTAPATVTLDRRIAGTTGSVFGFDIVNHLGLLHYAWQNDLGSVNQATIGTYDGSTYTDVVYTFPLETESRIFAMASAGDALYSTVFEQVAGTDRRIIADKGTEVVNLTALGSDFDNSHPDIAVF